MPRKRWKVSRNGRRKWIRRMIRILIIMISQYWLRGNFSRHRFNHRTCIALQIRVYSQIRHLLGGNQLRFDGSRSCRCGLRFSKSCLYQWRQWTSTWHRSRSRSWSRVLYLSYISITIMGILDTRKCDI